MVFLSKTDPWERLRALKAEVERKGYVRIIEAHSGLSGLVGETAQAQRWGQTFEFDGLWESSLTDSASKGLPDASIVGFDSRLRTIDEILNVTVKPIIVDGDTGGDPASFGYLVRNLERLGVSAVIIEDKRFPKRNSLDASADHALEDPELFSQKVRAGKEASTSGDFMIIARLESFIAGAGLEDALVRAERYIQAGADGIMVHSNKPSPDEVFAFAEAYGPLCQRLGRRPLLVCVPTTYNQVLDTELAERGFNIIIYANHLLRAAHKAMAQASNDILASGSAAAVEAAISPVRDLFAAVGYDRLLAEEKKLAESRRIPLIIPAAGHDPAFPGIPKSLVSVAGRPILAHQIDAARRAGLRSAVVIRGYQAHQLDPALVEHNVVLTDNPNYEETGELHSLFKARSHMDGGFVMAYADILFNDEVISALLAAGQDIVLAIDSSYRYHKHHVDKRLDLVVVQGPESDGRRSLQPSALTKLTGIGKGLAVGQATHEFIGLACFSAAGGQLLQQAYDGCRSKAAAPFHEASAFPKAALTDLLQELIDQGASVYGQEVFKGWMEVHNQDDVAAAERELAPPASPAQGG
jgi:phosphoenolpyruvate mutase